MLLFMKARETFLQVWEKEFQTTCRVFHAFPADQLDVKPHERSRSVRDLAWQCVGDERVIGMSSRARMTCVMSRKARRCRKRWRKFWRSTKAPIAIPTPK